MDIKTLQNVDHEAGEMILTRIVLSKWDIRN